MMIKKSESDLPSGYTRLNYLESTGTQYIDTDVILDTSKLTIEIDIIICKLPSKGKWATITATQTGSYARGGNIQLYSMGKTQSFSTGGNISADKGLIWGDTNLNTMYRYCVTWDDDKKTIKGSMNGIEKYFNFSGTIVTNLSLFLFAKNTMGILTELSEAKIFDLKIYKDNTIVRNFVPALDTANKPCLYDTVSKQPFYNQGAGEFLYG